MRLPGIVIIYSPSSREQHSTEVENALYADDRILDAAAVSVPDIRLGELVAAVVSTKPHYKGLVAEDDVIEKTKKL